MAGIADEAPYLDGISLAGALTEEEQVPLEREFFWETGKHEELKRSGWGALRKGDLKYVHSPKEGEFLFDIGADPNEKTDLKAERPDQFKKLRKRWGELAKQYRER